jgi:hypothetical protein
MADRNTGFVVVLQTYVLHSWCAYGPASRLWWPVPRPGMKGKRLLQNDLWMFQACVLGLPCKVKFDSDRPPLTRIETAYSFCHIE